MLTHWKAFRNSRINLETTQYDSSFKPLYWTLGDLHAWGLGARKGFSSHPRMALYGLCIEFALGVHGFCMRSCGSLI